MRVEDDVRGRYARYIHVYVLLDVNKFSKPGDQSGRWMPRHQGCQAAKPTKPDPMAWQGWYKNSNRTLYHGQYCHYCFNRGKSSAFGSPSIMTVHANFRVRKPVSHMIFSSIEEQLLPDQADICQERISGFQLLRKAIEHGSLLS